MFSQKVGDMHRNLSKCSLAAATCGVLVVALAGLTAETSAGARASLTLAPNSGGGAADQLAQGTMKRIAPGGTGRVNYIGKSRMSQQPDATARDLRSTGGRSALRVPHWFKGGDVGARIAKTAPAAGPLVTTPTVIHMNKGGTKQSQSSCGSCQPPDTNGAISSTRIVEAVNLSLTIYKHGGGLVARKSLASFFPTTRPISDPRILFDNRSNRWILVFIPIPETTTTTPQMFLAVSTSSDPNGSYFKYTISFSGGLYPPGTVLDYPMVGQDANAVIISTNNFQFNGGTSFTYLNSAAFTIPKSIVYAGGGFSFSSFPVAFSTHPAVARGKPIHTYTNSYMVAANSSGGFNLYFFTNTGTSTPTLTLQGTTANALWSPPPAAAQPSPNQATFLDTLDGRLQAPPIQADSFVWFAHTVNLSGFPAIQYGALNLATSGTGGVATTTQFAFESATSYDWNPSIALSEATSNQVRIFLNWAVTDPSTGQNVSLRVSGVGPGEGVPSLAGIGTTVFTGSGTSTNTRFGDFSSAVVEVKGISSTCLYNTQALVVNEVFNSGSWQARLARVGTC
jgi:hypothetical protein